MAAVRKSNTGQIFISHNTSITWLFGLHIIICLITGSANIYIKRISEDFR